MKEERHVIWSNYGLDYEEWRDDLEAEYPDLSENERISLMYEINGDSKQENELCPKNLYPKEHWENAAAGHLLYLGQAVRKVYTACFGAAL